MNILMISPHLPAPSWGAATRSYYLLKALAHQHSVSLIALTDKSTLLEDHVQLEGIPLKHLCQIASPLNTQRKRTQQVISMLRGRSYLLDAFHINEVQHALDSLFADEHYDVVIFESVFMSLYRLPTGVSAIIDQHNIEYELLQRTYQREKSWSRKLFNWRESQAMKPIELDRCREAQGVFVTSEREYLLLKRLVPRCVIEVVPNGVDIDVFSKADGYQQEQNLIVFVGTMNYYPNIDAVLFFAQHCWPFIRSHIPDARWQIVGKNPPPQVLRLAELPGVSVTGAVPDVKPYLAAAAVAVAPLLIGSGTRLKILEALAMGKAVVSTSLGCEGLSVVSGKHLVVADEPQLLAQSIVGLMQHEEKRITLGTNGRKLVESEYSWQQCGYKAVRALEKMVR